MSNKNVRFPASGHNKSLMSATYCHNVNALRASFDNGAHVEPIETANSASPDAELATHLGFYLVGEKIPA